MQEAVEVEAITWNASAPSSSTPTTSTAASSSPSRAGTRTRSWDSSAEDVAAAIGGMGWGEVEDVAGIFKGTDELRMYDAAALQGLQIDNAHYVYSVTAATSATCPSSRCSSRARQRSGGDRGRRPRDRQGPFDVVGRRTRGPCARPWSTTPCARCRSCAWTTAPSTRGQLHAAFKGQETRTSRQRDDGQMKRFLEELETIGQVDVAPGTTATGNNADGTTRPDNYESAVATRGTEVDLTNLGDQPLSGRNVTTARDAAVRADEPHHGHASAPSARAASVGASRPSRPTSARTRCPPRTARPSTPPASRAGTASRRASSSGRGGFVIGARRPAT